MKYSIEYGDRFIEFESVLPIDVKGMLPAPEPVALPNAIQEALAQPIGCESLLKIARHKLAKNKNSTVVIVVSDHTRPVPYRGENGLIYQIIRILQQAGFSDQQITILIGAGSHRNMESSEIEEMIGLSAMGLSQINVVNHEYDQPDQLVSIGQTKQGSKVLINKKYYHADLKIVTGLVESHFMAGASGGRKGICPAIVGKETLTLFHGARFLSSVRAADLILEENPLHEEASEIAGMAGWDFLVNVTIDSEKKVTGVFAGDLFAAHRSAVTKIREYVTVPLTKRYDIVIVPAGFVGINHYQAAKAAIEAARAVRKGGKMIIVANNLDPEPVGGRGYKEALELLARLGKARFIEMINKADWEMIPEQWQVQMWCKVLDVIEETSNIYYCALEIEEADYKFIPGMAGIKLIDEDEKVLPVEQSMQLMIERSLELAISRSQSESPELLLLKDGPYGIPELTIE